MRSPPLTLALMGPPYAGHLDPMMALAGALRDRGHRPVFIALQGVVPRIRQRGFEARALDAPSRSVMAVAELEAHLASLRGPLGLLGIGAVIDDLVTLARRMLDAGPALLRDLRPDGVVHDQLEPAAGLVARHLGLPVVSVANALMIDREPGMPPAFTDWPQRSGRWARERNQGGHRVADAMMRRWIATLADAARAWGLDEPLGMPPGAFAPMQIGQLSPELDFTREALPAGFRYVGPLRRPLDEEPPWTPPAAPTMPLAFVSLGTLQGGRAALMATLCQACRDAGLQPVVVHGGRLDAAQVRALPGEPIVAAHLPQRRVIPHCRVVVSHGGLNTVLDALVAGVPLALLPLAMEQGAIARRVERTGAGLALRHRWRSRSAVRRLLDRVQAQPQYAINARRIGATLRSGGGAPRAAEWIERHVQPAP